MTRHRNAPASPSAVRLTEAFFAWENRGRGWTVWDYSLQLEPPFRPLDLVSAAGARVPDDARRPSVVASWIQGLFGRSEPSADVCETPDEPDAFPAVRRDLCTIQVALAPDVKVAPDVAEDFLLTLATTDAPVSFE